MPIDLIHIILFGVALVLAIVIIVLVIKLSNKDKKSEKKIQKIEKKYQEEKQYYEKEIKRQQFILKEYKQRNGVKKVAVEPVETVANVENTVSEAPSGKIVSSVKDRELVDDIDFKEKNKKLWELSVAVHKEKERIDKMKREIEHRHEEVTKSITYAQRIQKALLPTSKILGVRFTDYFILWKPRDIVSGDFYWFRRLEDSMIIAVADCTGHGVPGAFMSLLGISFLNDILTKNKNLKSHQILDRLREMIKLALQQEIGGRRRASDGIDMGICIINNNTLEMDFAGANNPLYLIRNDKVLVFKENRNPVGIHPFEKPFKNHDFELRKGDRIYMFSDGFIDQFGGDKGRKFLKSNFQRLLLHIAQQDLPMNVEHEILEDAFAQWRGGAHPQVDDVLILGLKI